MVFSEKKYLKIISPAKYSFIGPICRFVCDILSENLKEFEKKKDFLEKIELVLLEACTNVVKHAYLGENGPLIFELYILDDLVEMKVGEKGKGFELEKVLEEKTAPLDEKGRGLRIIKALVDDLSYERGKDCNFLVLTKRIG